VGEELSAPGAGSPAGDADRRRDLLPWALVGVVVVWNLWELRATLSPAAYTNDSAMAEEMRRFATAQLRAGHDALTAWFP
jgi:hypothetical protein